MDRVEDLQLNQDLGFQEREWKWERFGWAVLFIVVALAVAGLFGNGPISWTTASTDDDSLEVAFERFGRRGGSQELTVKATAATVKAGVWEIEVSQEFLATMQINAIAPQPKSVEAVPDGVRYTFAQASDGADLEVQFALTPQKLWSRDGEFRLVGGEWIGVSQFLFP